MIIVTPHAEITVNTDDLTAQQLETIRTFVYQEQELLSRRIVAGDNPISVARMSSEYWIVTRDLETLDAMIAAARAKEKEKSWAEYVKAREKGFI